MQKVSFVLPTYKEREHIVSFIHKIQYEARQAKINYEIILVDDNSPDGTGAHVQETFKKDKHVKVVIRTKERGLATAILRGIKESSGSHVFLMDTDFNHDPRYIPTFLKLKEDFDLVVGSRYVWGGNMEGSRFRYFGSMVFNYWLAALLRMKSSDNTSGFVLFDKKITKKMQLQRIFKGYGEFYFRFLLAAEKLKCSLIEVPVVYGIRASGESKTIFAKFIFIYTWEGIKLFFNAKKLIK